MIWLSLRTQRTEMLIAAALVALLTVALVPSGLEMAAAYDNGLAACIGAQPASACGEAVHSFDSRFESLANTLGWLTLLPGLIGVLLAAPTILELEHGTHRLAWTQSITRGRWVAAKLGVAVVTASAAAGILILFFTWWHSPFDHLRGRLDASVVRLGRDGRDRVRPVRTRPRAGRRRRLATGRAGARPRVRGVRRPARVRRRLAAAALRRRR